MKKIILPTLSAFAITASADAALLAGQSIGLNFGFTAVDNFNAVHENYGGTTQEMFLLSDGVSLTGVDYTSTLVAGFGFSNGDSNIGSGAALPFTDSVVDNWSGAADGTIGVAEWTFTLQGLDNGLVYNIDLAIGAFTDTDFVDNTIVTASGGQGSVNMGDLSAEPVYASFTGLSTDGSGNLSFTVNNPTATVATLSGAVITAVPVPEPSSMLLFGLGGLSFLLRRKRS